MGKKLTAVGVLLVGIGSLAIAGGCGPSDKDDTFDPTGTFHGPASAIGQSGGKDVVVSEVDTITLARQSISIGSNCTLGIVDSGQVNVEDTTGNSGDDDGSTVRELASVQTPLDGQTCTIQTVSSGAVTFAVTDGLINVWRANDDATMEASISGTTSGGGSVTYNFTGYR